MENNNDTTIPTRPGNVQTSTKTIPNEENFLNLLGNLKVQTSIPSSQPKTFADSMLIYVDSVTSPSTKRLYVFARETGDWYYMTLT